MKLCIVMPALNEEATIADVIAQAPRTIEGIDEIQVIVVDDGSTDRTRELSLESGAVVVSHPQNWGVGAAFQSGVEKALELGADYMVNIDSDGQFAPADIPLLLEPLMAGRAEFASASRFKEKDYYPKMSVVKFWGNHAMSLLISALTGVKFYDVSCGFRAYTRDVLLNLNLQGRFTYTQETFLALSFKNIAMEEVPIKLVSGTRQVGKSRVASNLFKYAAQTSKIIFRCFCDYNPFKVFSLLSAPILLVAFLLLIFLGIHYASHGTFSPHKWAGFVGGSLFMMGFLILTIGVIADMLARIRQNQERILYLTRKDLYDSEKRR